MNNSHNLRKLEAWVSRITYMQIRHAEQSTKIMVNGKLLRGAMVADDLCLSRGKEFFVIIGASAVAVSNQKVAEKYNADLLRNRFELLLAHHKDFAKVRRHHQQEEP